MFDAQLYRDKAEVEDWKKRDPIDRLVVWMREAGALHDADVGAIEAEVAAEVERGGRLRRAAALGAGRGSGTRRLRGSGAPMTDSGASRSPIARPCATRSARRCYAIRVSS